MLANILMLTEISANHVYRFLMLTEIVANHVTIYPNFCRKVLVPKEMISTSDEDTHIRPVDIQISEEDEDTHIRPVERASNFENENESDTISSTEQWVRVIQNWMGMVGEENVDYSDSDEVASDFIAVDRTVHPADDQLAKWNLHSIFNNSLESPIFVNAMINSG